jgi:flagella basal body P-ring formation protein FlgA
MMPLRRLAAVSLVALAVAAARASASAATVAYAPVGQAPTQLVTGAKLASLANAVVAHLVTDPDRAPVAAFAPVDQNVPVGALAIAVGTPQVNPTYIAVPMQITVDGRVVRSVVAGYRVQQYVHTAVATHDLAPGEVLTSADIATSRVLSNGRPAVEPGSLVGRQMRAATNRGALLYVEQTSVVDLVKSGAGVILVIHDGPVALTADVVARTAGGLGDTVTVYNARTNKILSGTVTGPDRVDLQLPGDDE